MSPPAYQISFDWYKWKRVSKAQVLELLHETYRSTENYMLALDVGVEVMVYTGSRIRLKQ